VCCCLQRMLPPTWARQGANKKTVRPDTLSANLEVSKSGILRPESPRSSLDCLCIFLRCKRAMVRGPWGSLGMHHAQGILTAEHVKLLFTRLLNRSG
jgi:hypothetical protein